MAVVGEGFQDVVGGFGPDEGPGVLVPLVDPLADVGLELGDAAVGRPLVLAIPRRPARRSSLKDKGSSRTAGSDLGARPLATRPWGTVLYHGPGTSRKVYDLDLGSMERYPPPRLRKR